MRVWLDWYESHRRVRLHSHPLRGFPLSKIAWLLTLFYAAYLPAGVSLSAAFCIKQSLFRYLE
ncbi:Uncharacterised protein [Vibrio cholerae]|uniref:Uncharacterized protein n=1 Tax=Vibrio cholerae TaxID=666 RepID=A0A655V1P3_VIBCL|nr:Uncharacterised protein [Vibrio cholerae]CSB61550.1 Uncharacterised protein [Vibrio cholerae]CSB66095.1 Uncharacterised protein [Vibrio cholerae]CSC81719.1 Uncharacterised protein [Vibrio cholerae]CSC87748.1 Uncharacterised protein [Vibrio cholerae]